MTDLVRPVAGQPLSDSDGIGTLSTTMMDSYADLIESNEDSLTARTSSHIITTDPYSDIAELTLNDGTSLTGWHSTLPDAGEPTPTLVTIASRTAVQSFLQAPSGNLNPSLYLNLTEVGYAGGLTVAEGQTVSVDILLSQTVAYAPFTNAFAQFAVTLASGVDMTGTLVQRIYLTSEVTSNNLNTWYTIQVPVGVLTNIKSIGLKKVTTGGSGTARARWSLTNVHREGVTAFDQAYHSQNAVAVIVPPSYAPTSDQLPFLPSSLKAIVDFRPDHAVISGLGGHKNIREWGLDETGVLDVTPELQNALDSLSPGDVLEFPPTGIFRHDHTVRVNVADVTIDGCGAAFIQGDPTSLFDGVNKIGISSSLTDFRWHIDAAGVTLRRMRIFASHITPQNGSAFTAAGGAATSSTNMLLDGLNESASFSNTPARNELGETRQDLMLSDNNHVAADCVVTITDDDGVVIHTETLPTLTSTPTAYTINATPRNLFSGYTLKVTKATATANTITLAQMRTYSNCQTNWLNPQPEFCHGVYIDNGGDYATVEDCTIEGVMGDGIKIENGLPTTGIQNATIRRVFVRGNGRQATAPCGGRGHLYEDCYFLYSGRHGIDLEPEFPFGNPTPSAVEGITFRNITVWKAALGPQFQAGAAGPGFGRVRNITVEGLRTYGTGGVGGGFMDSTFTNLDLRAPASSNGDSIMQGRNNIWNDIRIDGAIQAGESGAPTGMDEYGVSYNQGGLVIKNVVFERTVLGAPYLHTETSGVHLENIRIADKVALDTTYAVGGVKLQSDTTYQNIDLAPHRALLPNSYPGVAIGQPWFPSGLDMKGRGLSRVAYLSGGTTKGNNLGRFQESVTAAATSKTVVFPAKTYPNVFTITLSNSTGGTLTAGTYHYRFAARNRFGGPVLATSDQSVTIAGTAVNMVIDGLYDVPTGIQIDGITVYRGPVGGASGNYTTRYDIVPTGDLHALGGAGTGNNKRMPLTDLGATITPFGNNFYQSYTFPYAATTGAQIPEDETGWEPDTNYAVFVEPSWQTTWRISARRRNGFDIEFGVPAPTGSNTLSWMIARF